MKIMSNVEFNLVVSAIRECINTHGYSGLLRVANDFADTEFGKILRKEILSTEFMADCGELQGWFPSYESVHSASIAHDEINLIVLDLPQRATSWEEKWEVCISLPLIRGQDDSWENVLWSEDTSTKINLAVERFYNLLDQENKEVLDFFIQKGMIKVGA